MTLRVECRSETRADERPVAVWLEGERLIVTELLDQWFDAGLTRDEARRRIFKLRLETGQVVFIEQDEGTGAWALRPERRREAPPGS